jgi:hypothetical protein
VCVVLTFAVAICIQPFTLLHYDSTSRIATLTYVQISSLDVKVATVVDGLIKKIELMRVALLSGVRFVQAHGRSCALSGQPPLRASACACAWTVMMFAVLELWGYNRIHVKNVAPMAG